MKTTITENLATTPLEIEKITKNSNLPTFLFKTLKTMGSRVAFTYIHEEDGNSWTGEEVMKIIRHGALGLKSIAIHPNDCVGIMFKSSPPWIMIEQMIISLGAVSVGIFDNLTSNGLQHYINETELKTIFIDEEENIKKIEPLKASLKNVILSDRLYKKIADHHALQGLRIFSWSELLSLGEAYAQKTPDAFQTALAKVKSSNLAAIIYTSGSTGLPKGVMLSHSDFIFQAISVSNRYPLDPASDQSLSILPIAHCFERTVVYFYMSRCLTIYQLSDPTKLRDHIGTIRPTIMTAVPRLLERIQEGMLARAKELPFPRRSLALAALHYAARCPVRQPKTLRHRLRHRLYEKLVYPKLRQALGGKLRFVISGGAALDTSTLQFFFALGIPLYEGYGLSETAPVISCNNAELFMPGSVGRPLAGINVKISKEAELIVQTPSIMGGYWKNQEKTQAVLRKDHDGQLWFHTGDKARLEDGFIFIEGRVKEFFKTSTGKYVNPVRLEAMLTKHALVEQALLIGEYRKFVSALLFVPLPDSLDEKTARNILEPWVSQINQANEAWEHIRKFTIIPKALTIANNELTPKLSLKRKEIEGKYKDFIESLYTSS